MAPGVPRLPLLRHLWLMVLLTAAARAASAQSVTFARDIAPLVHAKCASCHHAGGDAPFSLVTYDDVRARATQIVEATASGYMPPWKAVGGGPFVGDRRLAKDEIARFVKWRDQGTPAGTPLPAPPQFTSGWLHGTPDLVLDLPAFTLRADGNDVFRNFVVTIPGTAHRFVRSFQFIPGNRAVHHANIFVDHTQASRQLDAADAAAGYEGMILRSATFPDGHFLGWTPGQAPPPSADATWPLDGGSDLVVQLHMQPSGREEVVQPRLGLYLTDTPAPSATTMVRLGKQSLRIAANEEHYVESDLFVLPTDAQLKAIQPHAHQRATRVRAYADFPDGSRRTLIAIEQWDFRWQDQYRFVSPPWLPAGTTLRMEFTFDNTVANARNPDRPPREVEWGWRTIDEMGDVWLQLAARDDRDRERLSQVARRKMIEEDAVGVELLLSRQPDHVALRNDAGLIYMDLGRPNEAFRHFAAVRALQPESATAWFNEGVALEAMGRATDAEARYRRALAFNPTYSAAHNNLGNLRAAAGDNTGALAAFRLAITADTNNAEAHCSLARMLTIEGQPLEALREYSTATTLRPDWTPCLVSYAWLLAAHADASVRQPALAVTIAERAVALSGRTDPAALDALAVAQAAAGHFDAAVEAESAAVGLAERAASPATNDLRERLALFRARRPFVVTN